MIKNDFDHAALKKHTEQKERAERVNNLVLELSRELNVMGKEEEVAGAFINAIKGEHRTLQQCLMGVLFKTIHEYKDAPHDARNEGAVNACKRIDELLKGEDIHLPFI